MEPRERLRIWRTRRKLSQAAAAQQHFNCSGDILEGYKALTEFVITNYERELILEDSYVVYHLMEP